MEAHALPFAHGFFDALVSIDAYHYLGTDDLYLSAVRRLVRPGGPMAIAVPGLTEELEDGPSAPAAGLEPRLVVPPQPGLVAPALVRSRWRISFRTAGACGPTGTRCAASTTCHPFTGAREVGRRERGALEADEGRTLASTRLVVGA